MIDINRNPSRRDLQVFGLLLAVFAVALTATVAWKSAVLSWTLAVGCASAGLLAIYALVPAARRPIYVGWMMAAYPIGLVVSLVLLALIYFAVVTPMGWLRRRLAGDPLHRQWHEELPSYWIDRDQPASVARYFRQY